MSGKRQRPAHFQIDQKTLEYKQNPDQIKQSEKDSPEKISQRKIYKIKMGDQINKQSSSGKPKFHLFQNTPVQKQKLQNGEKSNKDQESIKKQEAAKVENKQDNKDNQKKQQKKDTFSLFPNHTSSIFGNGIGLFTANKGEGIFSKNNIFAKKDPLPGDTGRPAQSKPNSIFGTGQSIFNFSSNGVPPIKKQGNIAHNDDQDDQGDSAELEKNQNQEIDPKKSTGTYQYNTECQLLLQKKLIKFKRGQGDVVQNTEVIIQQDIEKKTNWLIVRLIATKHPILTGLIMKQKTSVKKLGSKQQNVVVSVVVIKDKVPERVILKLQFEKPEDGKQFTQVIEKLIK